MNAKEYVKEQLVSGKMGRILDVTYRSIVDRITPVGYFPESFTGKYDGEFPRSSGAITFLLTEANEIEKAKSILSLLFDRCIDLELPHIPHVFFLDPSVPMHMEDQSDAYGHCIAAYGLIASRKEEKAFREKYYPFMRKEIFKLYSEQYFFTSMAGRPLNLVRNYHLEHSRDYHYWDCFDFLTQVFVLKACKLMIQVATLMGDFESAKWLEEKFALHQKGMDENMTFVYDGVLVYREMLVCENAQIVDYDALSWLNLAALACGYTGLNPETYKNTVEVLLKKSAFVDEKHGVLIHCPEIKLDGTIGNYIFMNETIVDRVIYSKCNGWIMEYFRQNENYEGIAQWFQFYNAEHTASDLLTEAFVYANGEWEMEDIGNGEQCIWVTLALLKLKKQLLGE